MPPQQPAPATARRPADPDHGTLRGATRVSTAPIDIHAATATLSDPTGTTGAVVTFTGVVRADPHQEDAHVAVERLAFECFAEMAEAELERIRKEAGTRFGLTGITIQHRTGRLQVGEEIVLVATSAGHRKEAFEAAAWTMDEVKRRVPLWKQEHYADGTTRWVPGDSCGCGPAAERRGSNKQ